MTDQEFEPQEEVKQPEPPPRQPFYDEKTGEKYEKEDEKHEEKHNQDPLSSMAWALILIWAGLVYLANNLSFLEKIPISQWLQDIGLTELAPWALIFLGAGVIIFLEALIRTFVPAYRSSTGGNFFLAVIFICIGLNIMFDLSLIWPFILIALGFAALASAIVRSRKKKL